MYVNMYVVRVDSPICQCQVLLMSTMKDLEDWEGGYISKKSMISIETS